LSAFAVGRIATLDIMVAMSIKVVAPGTARKRKPARKKATKTQYHHGDLRRGLIESASQHISQEGIDSLTVRALARQLGVAHRAAYRHFPDKDSLLAETLTAAYLRLSTSLAAAAMAHQGTALDRLFAIGERYSAFALSEPHLFLAMTGPRVNPSGAFPELESSIRQALASFATAIADAQKHEQVEDGDPATLAVIFLSALQGVLRQVVLTRIKLSPRQRNPFIASVVRRLLRSIAR
jgi:AcrR family transcriptional regulator